MDGDPAEVRVPIALGIQADGKAYRGGEEGPQGYVLEQLPHSCTGRSCGGGQRRLLPEPRARGTEVRVMMGGSRGKGRAGNQGSRAWTG